MNNDPIATMLHDAGFTDGWALAGDVLIVWEHDADPPKPLVRPQESSDNAAE